MYSELSRMIIVASSGMMGSMSSRGCRGEHASALITRSRSCRLTHHVTIEGPFKDTFLGAPQCIHCTLLFSYYYHYYVLYYVPLSPFCETRGGIVALSLPQRHCS